QRPLWDDHAPGRGTYDAEFDQRRYPPPRGLVWDAQGIGEGADADRPTKVVRWDLVEGGVGALQLRAAGDLGDVGLADRGHQQPVDHVAPEPAQLDQVQGEAVREAGRHAHTVVRRLTRHDGY